MQFQLKAQPSSSIIYLSSMQVDLGDYGNVIHGSAPIDAAFVHKLVLPPLTCIASGFKHGATCSTSLQATFIWVVFRWTSHWRGEFSSYLGLLKPYCQPEDCMAASQPPRCRSPRSRSQHTLRTAPPASSMRLKKRRLHLGLRVCMGSVLQPAQMLIS